MVYHHCKPRLLMLPPIRRMAQALAGTVCLTCRDGSTLLTQFSYSDTFTSKRGESTPTLLILPISCEKTHTHTHESQASVITPASHTRTRQPMRHPTTTPKHQPRSAAAHLDHNLAAPVVIDDLELPNVACTLRQEAHGHNRVSYSSPSLPVTIRSTWAEDISGNQRPQASWGIRFGECIPFLSGKRKN